MCYSGRCVYEDYYGECRKPDGMRCPDQIEYEYEEMLAYERDGDDGQY